MKIRFQVVFIYQPKRGRLCGLVVRVPDYTSRGPGSIPGAASLSG
jgi:hypothetical protein